MRKERIILGIDPGTTVMGYGILKIVDNKPSVVSMGVVELKKYDNHYIKLKKIFDTVVRLCDTYLPDELAIEAPFFGKNVQSMLKLGRAQGVAMAAALSRDLPVFEYAPLKIKMAITGNGRSSKEQVANFLNKYLKIESEPKYLDATDGLAAALCHYFQNQSLKPEKKVNSWKEFMSKNPTRVKK
ncbi:crossover junction endodeoxyribonuclease RuvC [Saccharicrinis aurantiacus]|uniref:crossover junction endodeoxyribonuclease RuvC n=1 Tax=Saccharicrinis aurantiacus TaxID=1849719 RepID=UPI00094F7D5F|nr:crossover junction endodeoxyribonuclease RuvC [Saccharicrinis aurantiacus]